MFSKTFGYAIRAVTHVTAQSLKGQRIGLRELSEALGIPLHFLGKVMQDLVRHGVVDSAKGPGGGFYANKRTLSTPLLDVLFITDGSLVFKHCALGAAQCDAQRPCPLHRDFAVCRDGMLKVMSGKTIGHLVEDVAAEHAFITAVGEK